MYAQYVSNIHRHRGCKIKPSNVKCSREHLQHMPQGRCDVKSIQAPKERVKQNIGKWGRKLHVGECVVPKYLSAEGSVKRKSRMCSALDILLPGVGLA